MKTRYKINRNDTTIFKCPSEFEYNKSKSSRFTRDRQGKTLDLAGRILECH